MDFRKWIASQKTEIQQAFAEHVSGLRTALQEERRLRRHAEGMLATLSEAEMKTEDGKEFERGDYAYSPDGPSTWKLRLTDTPGGAPDPKIVGAAAAALSPGGFRGQRVEIPEADMAKVKAKVRAAWHKANPDMDDEDMPEGIMESAGEEFDEAEFSAENKREILHRALKLRSPGLECWIRDVFDDFFVYQVMDSSRQYRMDYSMAEDGSVTIASDPVEVIASTTYTPVMAESADEELETDFVPLVEKAVRKDGTTPIKLIDEGWGSSGYYSKKVLERDIPKVFPKGTKMYLDHPTASEDLDRPERSVKDIAAVLETTPAWKEKGPAGPGMYADMKVREEVREMVDELAPHIGLSIRAGGLVEHGKADGREGRIVKAIEVGKSVDIVTDPGRGGKILELYESLRKPASGGPSERQKPAAEGEHKPEIKENEMAEIDELKEANQKLSEEKAKQDEELARLREAGLLRDARDHAAAKLAKIEGLPEPTRNRLVESLAKKAPATKEGGLDKEAFDKAIDEAVKAEAKYLAEVGLGGGVRGMGGETPEAVGDEKSLEEASKKLDGAFEDLGLSEGVRKHAVAGRK